MYVKHVLCENRTVPPDFLLVGFYLRQIQLAYFYILIFFFVSYLFIVILKMARTLFIIIIF